MSNLELRSLASNGIDLQHARATELTEQGPGSNIADFARITPRQRPLQLWQVIVHVWAALLVPVGDMQWPCFWQQPCHALQK